MHEDTHALMAAARREMEWWEMSDEGCREGAPHNILYVTMLRIYMLVRGIIRARVSACVQLHQILMGTWSLVRPHYHNFFWGKNTEERVSFIATTTELQAKAGDKNSLKV